MRGWRTRQQDPDAAELGGVISDLRDRLRDVEQADQAGQRSIDDDALEVYDDDDALRGRIGRQPDGSFAVKAFGLTPQIPTEPDVIPVPGGAIVEWDGTFEEAQTDDVARIAIHVGTSADFAVVTGDEADDDEDTNNTDADNTEKAAILSPRGGSAFLALDPGVETYYVRLTAVAEGGAESAPTDAVEVIIAAPEAAFYQDEFVLAAPGSQTLQLTYTPLDHSDHLYWNGTYQREDVTWTRIGNVVTLTGTPYAAKTGDRIEVEYAYNPGENPRPVPLDGFSQEFLYDGGYLYVPGFADTNTDWSVEFLYKLIANPAAQGPMAEASNGVGLNQSWHVYVHPDGGVHLDMKDLVVDLDYTWREGATTSKFADHNAHHVAITYNKTSKVGRLIVDNEVVSTVTLTNNYQAGRQLIVGGGFAFTGPTPHGFLDEVATYTKVLTDTEIGDHIDGWRFGRLPEEIMASGPTSYLRLDEAAGGSTLCYDQVTGTTNGDLQAGATHTASPPLQKGQ